MEGGPPEEIPGIEAGDVPLQWSADGRALYVLHGEWEPSARIIRLDLRTGRREPWKVLSAPDAAAGVYTASITPDGRWYAYGIQEVLSDLYLVDGLR